MKKKGLKKKEGWNKQKKGWNKQKKGEKQKGEKKTEG